MKYFLLLLLATFQVSCSVNQSAPSSTDDIVEDAIQKRPDNASNYEQELTYPLETKNFVFNGIVQYDDPFYGAALSYIDNRDYPDIITVFVYPIAATSWSNQDLALDSETATFLSEIDTTVEMGAYQSRSEEKKVDFVVNGENQDYTGKKVHFEFSNKQGLVFNADAYFFIQKDKYIKIRTSSRKDFTPDWSGDLIAAELLPEFVVPDESEYMRNLREEYRRSN